MSPHPPPVTHILCSHLEMPWNWSCLGRETCRERQGRIPCQRPYTFSILDPFGMLPSDSRREWSRIQDMLIPRVLNLGEPERSQLAAKTFLPQSSRATCTGSPSSWVVGSCFPQGQSKRFQLISPYSTLWLSFFLHLSQKKTDGTGALCKKVFLAVTLVVLQPYFPYHCHLYKQTLKLFFAGGWIKAPLPCSFYLHSHTYPSRSVGREDFLSSHMELADTKDMAPRWAWCNYINVSIHTHAHTYTHTQSLVSLSPPS
jgi:hypothetical protein